MLVGCEPGLKIFRSANDFLLRKSAEAALDGGRNVGLRGEGSEAAKVVTWLVPEQTAADPLWSLPDGLSLCYCLVQA